MSLNTEEEAPIELELDLVPSLDSDSPVATYKTWRAEDTRVITYSIGDLGYPGRPAVSRDQALADCKLVFGKVLEANYVPGRAFLRVMR